MSALHRVADPARAAWELRQKATSDMDGMRRMHGVAAEKVGRYSVYARLTPVVGPGGVILNAEETYRFHVFECDPTHDTWDDSWKRSHEVSHVDRPDGFATQESAMEWILSKMRGRRVFWVAGGQAHQAHDVGGGDAHSSLITPAK